MPSFRSKVVKEVHNVDLYRIFNSELIGMGLATLSAPDPICVLKNLSGLYVNAVDWERREEQELLDTLERNEEEPEVQRRLTEEREEERKERRLRYVDCVEWNTNYLSLNVHLIGSFGYFGSVSSHGQAFEVWGDKTYNLNLI